MYITNSSFTANTSVKKQGINSSAIWHGYPQFGTVNILANTIFSIFKEIKSPYISNLYFTDTLNPQFGTVIRNLARLSVIWHTKSVIWHGFFRNLAQHIRNLARLLYLSCCFLNNNKSQLKSTKSIFINIDINGGKL